VGMSAKKKWYIYLFMTTPVDHMTGTLNEIKYVVEELENSIFQLTDFLRITISDNNLDLWFNNIFQEELKKGLKQPFVCPTLVHLT
jgi:hypothetical protein